jgi:hypothetical protein
MNCAGYKPISNLHLLLFTEGKILKLHLSDTIQHWPFENNENATIASSMLMDKHTYLEGILLSKPLRTVKSQRLSSPILKDVQANLIVRIGISFSYR